MKGYTEPEKLKCWWPTMLVMHTRARYKTLQMGPHWTTTYFLEVAKPAGMCSTLRIHSQCECCTSAEFAGCHQIFFFQMAHDKVFGIRCNELAPSVASRIQEALRLCSATRNWDLNPKFYVYLPQSRI